MNGKDCLLLFLGLACLITSCTSVWFVQKHSPEALQKIESVNSADSASIDVKLPIK